MAHRVVHAHIEHIELTHTYTHLLATHTSHICALLQACTFGALVNQTRRSYTDLTCPLRILEADTFGRVNLSKNYLANGIRPRLLSAAER